MKSLRGHTPHIYSYIRKMSTSIYKINDISRVALKFVKGFVDFIQDAMGFFLVMLVVMMVLTMMVVMMMVMIVVVGVVDDGCWIDK